jgi:hypothetical protein
MGEGSLARQLSGHRGDAVDCEIRKESFSIRDCWLLLTPAKKNERSTSQLIAGKGYDFESSMDETA